MIQKCFTEKHYNDKQLFNLTLLKIVKFHLLFIYAVRKMNTLPHMGCIACANLIHALYSVSNILTVVKHSSEYILHPDPSQIARICSVCRSTDNRLLLFMDVLVSLPLYTNT